MVSNKAIRQSLYEKLNVASVTTLLGSGSASLVHEVGLPSATYPLCVFFKSSGISDDRVMGGDFTKNMLWTVKGIARSASASAAEDIDKAVNDLLHFGDLAITGADDMYLARESDVEYAETDGDVQYRHVGGVYRLRVQDA